MVAAINKGPKGYKSPSSEKARTSLLDACKRNVEQDLGPVRKTWYATVSIYNAYEISLYNSL
jgi:ATP phosphoribosyltransferase regulatory subunit HisZ